MMSLNHRNRRQLLDKWLKAIDENDDGDCLVLVVVVFYK